jgi:hypothetical protein
VIALNDSGLEVSAERGFEVIFRGQKIGIIVSDLIVEKQVIVELKSYEHLKKAKTLPRQAFARARSSLKNMSSTNASRHGDLCQSARAKSRRQKGSDRRSNLCYSCSSGL